MSDVMFDTLRLAKGFKESGVPDGQAEGMARAIGLEWQSGMDALATKADLERLEARMATKEDLAVLEARMATKDEVTALLARVTAIETTMATKEALVRVQSNLLLAGISAIGLSTAILGVLIKL
ncbi:MAG: hypothetical protein J5I81_05415 [Nitrococcus mobilis]|nr:hypothetical protein [Nitrococcus mobilis]